jgi:hypothetical protein
MMTPSEDTLITLQTLAHGLLWPSESDYPIAVTALDGGPASMPVLLERLHLPVDAPIEQRTVYNLFANVCREADWMDDEARAKVQRFVALRDAILGRLRHPFAYRVGTIEITILVVGQDTTDRWLCLRTTAIET